jgi:pyruvate dehydrogenase E2 component (dihydrolipoamide acetyltransferase)
MSVEIIVPKLGMSTQPITLIEWKAKEGDWVEEGAIVLEVETEKIRHDIEAAASGFLHILVKEGSEAPIGSLAGLIAETKEELEALQKETATAIPTVAAESKEASQVEAIATPKIKAGGKRVSISPVARKMAEEHVIDIVQVAGTGPRGRIIKEDIEREIEAKKKVEVVPAEIVFQMYQGKRIKSTLPFVGTRKTIAEHMYRSLSTSAQITVMGEIDMTEMVKLRQSLLAQEETLGTRITYTDLLVFVMAKVFQEYPMINSSLIDNEIKLWEDINIAVAVAVEDGLIVPVIKNADRKSLVEISQAMKTLVKKARERTLEPEEVEGGTFTLTNLGALGSGYRFETVIINQPESAILGTGSITERVVARDGQAVIRPIMTYYLTYDHRIIDGALAGRFMTSVIRLLENPGFLLTKVAAV